MVVPNQFLDIGTRTAVGTALHRLAKQGVIRRLARGVFDYPRSHPVLGPLWPSAETVAQAIVSRDSSKLQATGAYAANLLGLSEQVPAKVVFLTNGPSRTVEIGPTVIQLRHTTPRNMEAAGTIAGLVIQAFRHLGKEHVTPERIAHLKQTIPPSARSELTKHLKSAPAWMHSILRELAEAPA